MVSSIGFNGPPPVGGGGMMRPPQALTEEQQQTVQDLLEEYDPDELTAEDAKAIFKAFQEAGIRGPGLREAVKEAGFDPDELFTLAHDGQKPPPPPSGGAQRGGQINLSSLQSLQNILQQFDLNNMTTDQEEELLSQLNQAGLLNSGRMINIGA